MDAQEKSVQGHAGFDARMETLPSSGRGKEEKEGGREGEREGGRERGRQGDREGEREGGREGEK